MKFKFLSTVITSLIFSSGCVYGVEKARFAHWSNDTITLDNGHILRKIHYDHNTGSLTSETLILKEGERESNNFITEGKNLDFDFLINGEQYTGNSGWKLLGIEPAKDKNDGNVVVIKLSGPDPISDITIEVTYLLYPDLPVLHKYISFTNLGSKDFKLEALDIEHLAFPWRPVNNYVMTNYARNKHFSTYVGNWDDPLVVLHDMDGRRGIALGNETPCVLKRTAYRKGDWHKRGTWDTTKIIQAKKSIIPKQ